MKRKNEIPVWGWYIIFFLVLFVGLPFIRDVFRQVPLVFFFLWVGCPCIAWVLRSLSLDKLLTSRGYSKARGILVGIAVAMSFSFFTHYDYFQNKLQYKYLDPVKFANSASAMTDAAIHYEETGEWPYGFGDVSANNLSDKGKVILYMFQWVMIAMWIGIPILTWKTASTAIKNYEKRKRESNNRIDSDDE